jgi:hypothetical protein
MELFADVQESIWQTARLGNIAKQRELLAKVNIAPVVRPGQMLFQAPLRILRCYFPLDAQVRQARLLVIGRCCSSLKLTHPDRRGS